MNLIECRNVNLAFAKQQVFANMNLSLAPDGKLALLGPSGIGKSSLLKLLTGIHQPDSGSIVCRAKRIGYVFQEPRLLPWLSVKQNLLQVLVPYKLDKKVVEQRIEQLLVKVELSDFGNHYPHQLSGGMAQRVSLARAFAVEPDLLLMDEPLSALDPLIKNQLSQFIAEYVSQHEVALIYVSHDVNETLPLVDAALLLQPQQEPVHYPVEHADDIARIQRILNPSPER